MNSKFSDNEEILTPELLWRILDYNAETGAFTHKIRPAEFFSDEISQKRWNARCAGKEAFGTISKGKRIGRVFGANVVAARAAWAMHYGQWPLRPVRYHNLDRTDVRISNLYLVEDGSASKGNQKSKNNTSGVTGVRWRPKTKNWKAVIKVNGKEKYIGVFQSKQEAISARRDAEKKYGFHENHGLTSRVVKRRDGSKFSVKR